MLRAPVLFVLVASACGPSSSGGNDAGTSDPDGATATEPAPAVEATLPEWTACPPGWQRSSRDGVELCHPFVADGHDPCTGASMQLPGEMGCASVGAACPSDPADPFASELPVGLPVVYVLQGAPAGGDGTRGAPLSSIGAGLAAAPAGGVVAVGVGTYDQLVVPRRDVILVGACPPSTTIAPSFGPGAAVGVNDAVRVEVHDLTVSASSGRGVAARGAGAVAVLRGVVVDGAIGIGVSSLDGAMIDADGLLVRNTTAGGMAFGRGISVDAGGTATIQRAVVTGNTDAGLAVVRGSNATFSDLVVRDTRPRATDLRFGRGVTVQDGSTAMIERAYFFGNSDVAVYVSLVGASGVLQDVVVEQTQPRPADGRGGRGVEVWGGADAVVSRLGVLDGGDTGIFVSEPGTTATFEDAVAAGMSGTPAVADGRGLGFQVGAVVEARRVASVGNLGTGALFGMADVIADDLVVRETRSDARLARRARGVQISHDSQVVLTRTTIDGNADLGMVVAGTETRLTATDLSILNTLPDERGGNGRGLSVQLGGTAVVERLDVRATHQYGVLYIAEAAGEIRDAVVLDTSDGICASAGDCAPDRVAIGIGSVGATLRVTRFRSARAAQCGIYVDGGTTGAGMDLADGRVDENPIGACVRGEYDFQRLSTDVRYTDNGANLDATELPVPELAGVVPPTMQ